MHPRENIYFILIGVILLVVIILIWLIFRSRKKWAIAFSSMLVIGFVGYYLSFPTIKVNTHAERYEQVNDYLAENYPNKKFTILPKYYEEGYTVGQFDVNKMETPTIGVTLRVDKKGEVTQVGTWSNKEYPTQQELWQEIEFMYGETYTLDKEIAEITKQDEWMEGELTAFALSIDDMPAIALFHYSSKSFGLLELRQGERGGFISIEEEGYVFIYIDKSYQGEIVTIDLKNGEEYKLNVDQHKGKLIVKKII